MRENIKHARTNIQIMHQIDMYFITRSIASINISFVNARRLIEKSAIE